MAQVATIILSIALHYFISMLIVTINTITTIIKGYWQQLLLSTITIAIILPCTTVITIIIFVNYSNKGFGISAYFVSESVQVLLGGPLDLKNEVHE